MASRKSEPTAIEAAEAIVAEAHREHRSALAIIRQHQELIERTETELAALNASVGDSLASPEAGAAWRTRRADLVGELEGLKIQAEALRETTKATEANIRAAERTLEGALQDDLTARLAEAEAGLRPHVAKVMEAYALHCERHRGYFSDRPSDFGDWLIGVNGLFRLAEFRPQ